MARRTKKFGTTKAKKTRRYRGGNKDCIIIQKLLSKYSKTYGVGDFDNKKLIDYIFSELVKECKIKENKEKYIEYFEKTSKKPIINFFNKKFTWFQGSQNIALMCDELKKKLLETESESEPKPESKPVSVKIGEVYVSGRGHIYGKYIGKYEHTTSQSDFVGSEKTSRKKTYLEFEYKTLPDTEHVYAADESALSDYKLLQDEDIVYNRIYSSRVLELKTFDKIPYKKVRLFLFDEDRGPDVFLKEGMIVNYDLKGKEGEESKKLLYVYIEGDKKRYIFGPNYHEKALTLFGNEKYFTSIAFIE